MAISIIIPVYNAADKLDICLQRIFSQTISCPIEVIVVDNGSIDHLKAVISKYNNIVNLNFTEYQSPYPCRNLGIKSAKFEYLALLDAKCWPVGDWLQSGVDALSQAGTDIVAGPILYKINDLKDPYQIYSKIKFVDVKTDINNGGIPFGCVFAKRSTFIKYGLLPENIRSNGDSIWSKKAFRMGAKIYYEEKASVEYLAKSRKNLLSEAIRIGLGNRGLFINDGKTRFHIFIKAIWNMRPDTYRSISMKCRNNSIHLSRVMTLRVWLVMWEYKIYKGLGRMGIRRFLDITQD